MAMSMDARLSMEHTDALGHVVFTCHAWRRLFEIKGPLVRELMLEFFSTCRFADIVLDLEDACNPRGYWDEISSSGDFLTTVPSYIQIMDSLRRFCYRLITYTITGRGQTPKKAVPAPVQVLQPPPLDVVRTMPQRMTRLEEEVPRPSDPTESVAYEAIHKELGDSLVWAATTAFSLEAEQDSGNITKTQSKETPNESSSIGTTSGGGPRCQETIGDTIAQTRVLDLEKTKTTQANEIASLRRRVNKLEKKNRSRTHKLKKIYKVGLTARVESSRDEESLGEDASNQGRINVIDVDNEITLGSVKDDADKEMFDVDALNGEEVFVAGKNENVVEEVVDDAQVSTAATTVTITTEEITLAQALEALKTSKPKDKGKRIMIEEPVKPIKKKDLTRLDEEFALKLQIDADHQLAKRFQAQEQEELSVKEKATLFQQLLEKRRKHFRAKRAEEKRNKPPTKAQQRKIMCTYLKNMEVYKLNDLKLKDFDYFKEMFDRAFKRVNTFEDFRTELVEGKEKRGRNLSKP
ncbi:hypothetical protein Tco_0554340 [Tanacetum coccineum]